MHGAGSRSWGADQAAVTFRRSAWNHFQRQAVENIVSDPYWAGEEPQFRDSLRIVVGAHVFGPNADKIARGLGLNRDKFVRPRARRLRESGIWRDGGVEAPDDDNPLLDLTMQGLVAEGLVCRQVIPSDSDTDPQ